MIKSITNFLIIFFMFQPLKSQISQIDQNGYNSFCDETLHLYSWCGNSMICNRQVYKCINAVTIGQYCKDLIQEPNYRILHNYVLRILHNSMYTFFQSCVYTCICTIMGAISYAITKWLFFKPLWCEVCNKWSVCVNIHINCIFPKV